MDGGGGESRNLQNAPTHMGAMGGLCGSGEGGSRGEGDVGGGDGAGTTVMRRSGRYVKVPHPLGSPASGDA
jgi:hypothetical protein